MRPVCVYCSVSEFRQSRIMCEQREKEMSQVYVIAVAPPDAFPSSIKGCCLTCEQFLPKTTSANTETNNAFRFRHCSSDDCCRLCRRGYLWLFPFCEMGKFSITYFSTSFDEFYWFVSVLLVVREIEGSCYLSYRGLYTSARVGEMCIKQNRNHAKMPMIIQRSEENAFHKCTHAYNAHRC